MSNTVTPLREEDYQAACRALLEIVEHRGVMPFFALLLAALEIAGPGQFILKHVGVKLSPGECEALAKLQAAFPELWQEIQARHMAPGAMLPADPGFVQFLDQFPDLVEAYGELKDARPDLAEYFTIPVEIAGYG